MCVGAAYGITLAVLATDRSLRIGPTVLPLTLLTGFLALLCRTEENTGIPLELTSNISAVFVAAGFRGLGIGALIASSVFAANILHFPLFALTASIALRPSGKLQWAVAEGYTASLAVGQ